MLTAYDFSFASLFDQAGIDVLLVGDSLGNVVQGQATTLPVTLDEMIYHTRLVARGARRALVVADLPFGSYQITSEDGLRSAVRCVKEGGAHAVKLEGGRAVAETIARIVAAEIPVMGHVGLTPQAIHRMGGHRVQGRGESGRARVLADARAVEAAGAFAVVLEGMPAELAAEITRELAIPDDRHRRRGRLRRAGAGDARPARALGRGSELRQAVREPRRAHRPGGAPLRRRGRAREVPRRRSTPTGEVSVRILTTVAELQALADAERAAGRRVALVPDDGSAARGPPLAGRRGPAPRRPRLALDLREPDAVRGCRAISRPIRARSRRISRCVATPGVDVVFAPAAAEMAPGGRADLGRGDGAREAAVRPLAPGAFPRRRDGRDQAAAGRQAARRRLRREGLPAARRDPPAGERPALRRRDRGRADPARAGRARDVEPQRAPRPRGAPPGPRALAGARRSRARGRRRRAERARGCSRWSSPRSRRRRAP